MIIKILGTGCPKCKTLTQLTNDVIIENLFDAEVQKVEDITQIMGYGVMRTPGIVINEKVVLSGRIPAKNEIKELILKHTV
jgi:small redox-active disulfide protein 2